MEKVTVEIKDYHIEMIKDFIKNDSPISTILNGVIPSINHQLIDYVGELIVKLKKESVQDKYD